jgi:hypothetical protein
MTALRITRLGKNIVYQLFALILACVIILPIIYAFFISFMPASQILRRPPVFIPRTWILSNYKMAITLTTLGRFMLNSLILAGFSSVVRVIISAMAAFGFVFFNFRFKNVLFYDLPGDDYDSRRYCAGYQLPDRGKPGAYQYLPGDDDCFSLFGNQYIYDASIFSDLFNDHKGSFHH